MKSSSFPQILCRVLAGVVLAGAIGTIGAMAAENPATLTQLDDALRAAAGFEYGKEAAALVRAEQIVLETSGDAAMRDAVAARLVNALQGTGTPDAKEFLCRQLAVVGGKSSIPVLEPLLTDARLAHVARRALDRMAVPEAGQALQRALKSTKGVLQVGVLNSLGARREAAATDDILPLLSSGDADVEVAQAAATALGRIGNAAAIEALGRAVKDAPGALKRRIQDALLVAADLAAKENRTPQALAIYQGFFAEQNPPHLRIAGLRGLMSLPGHASEESMLGAVLGADPGLRSAAIGFARLPGGSGATLKLAAAVTKLPPAAAAALVDALGTRGDAAALPPAVAAAGNPDASVRVAALGAIGKLGGAAQAEFLAQAAAKTQGPERQAARGALSDLRGADASRALVELAARTAADSRVRVECVQALAARHAEDAVPALLKLGVDSEGSVRAAAIQSLGVLAQENHLTALTALLVNPKDPADREPLAEAIEASMRRVADSGKQAAALLQALPGASDEAKAPILKLLGKPATDLGLAAVTEALRSGTPAVREAALRSLVDWPNATPAPTLLKQAGELSDPVQKALALRGYVRMAGLSKDPTAMYARAMELSQRPEDRNLVLSGLGAASGAEGLPLVEKSLEDPALQAAAGLAAVQIVGRLPASDGAKGRQVLRTVIARVQQPTVQSKAKEALNELEKYEGYLLTWLASPIYMEKEKGSHDLFDAKLPPEVGAPNVVWQPLNKGIGSWDLDLEAFYGAHDECAAYLRARVWAPQAMDARLEMGSDDAIKAWLNGAIVHSNYQERGMSPRQDIVPVKLREGWNDLMLKVVDQAGGWAACCRVRGADGGVIAGLKSEAGVAP